MRGASWLDGVAAVGAVAAGAFRRLIGLRTLAVAALAGGAAGALAHGLGWPELAFDVLSVAVPILCSLIVLPRVAAVVAGERAGGYEQLVAARPVSSLHWATGRLMGAIVASALLSLTVAGAAWAAAGSLRVPERVEGVAAETGVSRTVWRFPLAAGTTGPFDLAFETIPTFRSSLEAKIHVRRGSGRVTLERSFRPARHVTVAIDGLDDERGDLFVSVMPGPDLVLAAAAPTLVVGTRPLAASGLPLDTDARRALLLAVVVVVAAACAFRFETACLAAVLVLALRLPERTGAMLGLMAALWLLSVWGTALVRRQALP